MKYNKSADSLLFLLLFTGSMLKKLQKHLLVQAREEGEKQLVLEVLYRIIYWILKVIFE